MNDELKNRVAALAAAFLAARVDEPETAERFFNLNNALFAWAEEQGIDEWTVHDAINEAGARLGV